MVMRGWLAQPGSGGWWRGAGGVRAGWRVGLFLLLAAAFMLAEALLARLVPRALVLSLVHGGGLTPGFVVLNEMLLLVPVALATLVMASLEGRRFSAYGLGGQRRLARLAQGALAGLVFIGLLVALLAATGHASLAWGGLGAGGIAVFALGWALASLLTGLTEEFCLRGYLLQVFNKGLGFWPALAITSLLFGLVHIGNHGEGGIGIATAVMGGAIMALGVRGTGALWWSIGLHGAWDYAENFLAGTPDSGQICLGTLLHFTPRGPAYLSGGATGPEGSLFALALLAPALVLAWRAFTPGRV